MATAIVPKENDKVMTLVSNTQKDRALVGIGDLGLGDLADLDAGALIQVMPEALTAAEAGCHKLGNAVVNRVPALAVEDGASPETEEYHNKSMGAAAAAVAAGAFALLLGGASIFFAGKANAARRESADQQANRE